MFFAFASISSPSRMLSSSDFLRASRSSSRYARRDTTTLAFLRESFRTLNFPWRPMTASLSRTGRMSTWLPGGKGLPRPLGQVGEREHPLGLAVDVDCDVLLEDLDHHPADDFALLGVLDALLIQRFVVVFRPCDSLRVPGSAVLSPRKLPGCGIVIHA